MFCLCHMTQNKKLTSLNLESRVSGMIIEVTTKHNSSTGKVTVYLNGIKVGEFSSIASIRQFSIKLRNGRVKGITETMPGTLIRVGDEIDRQARVIQNKGLID
jgi:hypothetical protein